jgi:DNA ligase 1
MIPQSPFSPWTRHPLQRRGFMAGLLVGAAAGWSRAVGAAQAMPDLLLASNAPAGLDPTPYLVSEKYDGVRGVWDGQVLRFRSGRVVAAPDWFLARLPAVALDGELWLGRGRFDGLSGLVRRNEPQDALWAQVQFMVFELPGASGSFAQRTAQLQGIAQTAAWPQLQAVEQTRLTSHAALMARLKSVTAAGGEGLMLHLASAPVSGGRSEVLLKLKPVQDAEGVVLAHLPGKGKHAGLMGALEVQTASGLRFRLGTGFSDAQRQSPPPVGSSVTYTYRDLTPAGKPRFASFLRIHEPA